MTCSTMAEMKLMETYARVLCKSSKDDHLQMLYGQWTLTAQQMQRQHWDSCYECQGGPEQERPATVTETPAIELV